MQIIVSGKRDYRNLLSFSSSKEEIFVPSKYVLRNETEEGTLLCNTLTGELVQLSSKEKAFFDSLPGKMDVDFAEMASRRFIVSEKCREEKTIDQLRSLTLRRKEATGLIRYFNILPTTYCNARCFYCFESGIRRAHMSSDTAEQLVEYIASRCGGKAVRLSWFGGEPMIGKERIDQICDGLDKRQITFQSDMTSNGYLFDESSVKCARNKWNLKKIQITLDGTEEIYNRTKAYAGVNDNPYERVIRNIGYLQENGVQVNIRLNLDLHNSKDLENLIEELADIFGGKPNIYVYIHTLFSNVGFMPIQHKDEDQEMLKVHMRKLRRTLEEKGWKQFNPKDLPALKATACMADDPASIQCTPDGILSKCEDQIYNHSIGTLSDGITDRKEISWWRDRVIHEECKTCPLYPSCAWLLAHCPTSHGECRPEERERRINGYQELMLTKYQNWKKTKQAEEKNNT